jgi:hypothetical protein
MPQRFTGPRGALLPRARGNWMSGARRWRVNCRFARGMGVHRDLSLRLAIRFRARRYERRSETLAILIRRLGRMDPPDGLHPLLPGFILSRHWLHGDPSCTATDREIDPRCPRFRKQNHVAARRAAGANGFATAAPSSPQQTAAHSLRWDGHRPWQARQVRRESVSGTALFDRPDRRSALDCKDSCGSHD